jgi:hypothetical protein
MPWTLAREAATSPANYIVLRLKELRLEVLAARWLGADHGLTVCTQTCFQELETITWLDGRMSPLIDWDTWRGGILQESGTTSDEDKQAIRDYIEARPYPDQHSSHPQFNWELPPPSS